MDPIQNLLLDAAATCLRPAPLSAAKVQCAWRLAVGASLARATEARLGEGGVLDVDAGDSPWRREVERSRDLILQRLRAMLGPDVVRTIRVRTPPGPGPRRRTAPRQGLASRTPEAS